MGTMTHDLGFGEPRPADVAGIEAGLAAMWRSASDPASGKSLATRASALTLLVYVDCEEAAHEVSNLIAEVTLQNPCRSVVMVVNPQGSPPGLMASISAHCHMASEGEKQICSEQITLHARGETGPELVSVVLPLTISGLPIYLWWRAGNFDMADYFDVDVPDSLYGACRKMIEDRAYREQRSAQIDRAKLRTWAQVARETTEALVSL